MHNSGMMNETKLNFLMKKATKNELDNNINSHIIGGDENGLKN
jgi:hypothetical protein